MQRYAQDVVFDQPIVTADGVALGGHHRLTLRHDGSFRYQGHLRATGLPSYDVALASTLSLPIPVPGSSGPGTVQLAFATQGRVSGSNESGPQEHAWDQHGQSSTVQAEWAAIRRSALQPRLEYNTDWFGDAGGVLNFLAQIVAMGAAFGGPGVAIVLAGEAAELLDFEQLVLPGAVGVIVAGGAGYVLGPSALIPAFFVGGAVTLAAVNQRHMDQDEREFADEVFRGTIPYSRVLLTNLVGLGGRPFTTPAAGGAILVNLGEGYEDPMGYTGKGGEQIGINAPGQLLIHELVHAWQIANHTFTPHYYCDAVATAAGTTGDDMSAYWYGDAGPEWGAFGTEQQGSIVDQWFAGNMDPDTRSRQRGYTPMNEEEYGASGNPYYRYIRDNIRRGIA